MKGDVTMIVMENVICEDVAAWRGDYDTHFVAEI